VKELLDLGLVDEATGRADGWATQKGLRIHGGHTTMELPWPELDDWPSWGATASRRVFDATIARTAAAYRQFLTRSCPERCFQWSAGSGTRGMNRVVSATIIAT
jgi:hypothetical protein